MESRGFAERRVSTSVLLAASPFLCMVLRMHNEGRRCEAFNLSDSALSGIGLEKACRGVLNFLLPPQLAHTGLISPAK